MSNTVYLCSPIIKFVKLGLSSARGNFWWIVAYQLIYNVSYTGSRKESLLSTVAYLKNSIPTCSLTQNMPAVPKSTMYDVY